MMPIPRSERLSRNWGAIHLTHTHRHVWVRPIGYPRTFSHCGLTATFNDLYTGADLDCCSDCTRIEAATKEQPTNG